MLTQSASPKIVGNNPQVPLFQLNEQSQSLPRPPIQNLQERQITVKKEPDFDSSFIQDEGTEEVKVKEEPGLELPVKELLGIKTVRKRIKLINPNFNPDKEVGVENCLPCVISYYNWIKSGAAFPEKVDPLPKPMHEHMIPINDKACLLQDPFLDKLNNPKAVNELDGEGQSKEYICLTEDLPLTFKSVSLVGLKAKIESTQVAWQQYENSVETFKTGILFLNYRDDDTKAHFLAFEYCRTKKGGKNTKIDSYTLYITDPQSGNVFTFAQFLKDYRYSYADNIKIWSGQNQINYNCNKTVKEMFEALKEEEANKGHEFAEMESNVKDIVVEPFKTKIKISFKRKLPNEEETIELTSVNVRPEPVKENAWARVAKMARTNSLNIVEMEDESWEKEILETPSNFVPKSILSTIERKSHTNIIEKSEKEIAPENIGAIREKDFNTVNGSPNVQENISFQPQLHVILSKGINSTSNDSFIRIKHDADKGDANARLRLGLMFMFGYDGAPQDPQEAFKYFKLVEHRADAKYQIGNLYRLGFGVKQDFIEAVKYYNQAADLGNVEAQVTMGQIYFCGPVSMQDSVLAFKYFQLAAEKGHAEAQIMLGKMYATGVGGACWQDFSFAFRYLKLAADNGHAEAQFKVGNMYFKGQAVQNNFDEGKKYFKLAAVQGFAEAQVFLGKLYLYQKNYPEAFKYCKLAADLGDEFAQNAVADMYYHGRGVARDFLEAKKYYQFAANQSNKSAQIMLNRMYQRGQGVEIRKHF